MDTPVIVVITDNTSKIVGTADHLRIEIVAPDDAVRSVFITTVAVVTANATHLRRRCIDITVCELTIHNQTSFAIAANTACIAVTSRHHQSLVIAGVNHTIILATANTANIAITIASDGVGSHVAVVDGSILTVTAKYAHIGIACLNLAILHRTVLDHAGEVITAKDTSVVTRSIDDFRIGNVQIADFTDIVPTEKTIIMSTGTLKHQIADGMVVAHKGALEHLVTVVVVIGISAHRFPVGFGRHVQIHNQFEVEVHTAVLNLGKVANMGRVIRTQGKVIGGVGHIVETVLVDDITEILHFRKILDDIGCVFGDTDEDTVAAVNGVVHGSTELDDTIANDTTLALVKGCSGIQSEGRTLLNMPLTNVATLHIKGVKSTESGFVVLQQHRHH